MTADLVPATVTEHTADLAGGTGSATFSGDRAYRYLLARTWDPARPPVTWIMLNPSTAGAFTDDATIRRCVGFACREGAGGIEVVNLFAFQATDPAVLGQVPDPVGPCNDSFILAACPPGRTVIAAWGTRSSLVSRAATVTAMLAAAGVRLHCLGTTRQGHPRHPLYLPAAAPLTVLSEAS